MSTAKRKHSTLSIKEKYDIIIKLSQGCSGKSLAQQYNIGTSTISDIKKKSDKILSFVATNAEKIDKARTLRHQEFPEMEQKLSDWYFEQQQRHETVSESVLTAKAREIFRQIYGTERHFAASRGWLWKFRKRFGIANMKCQRNKSPCNSRASPLMLDKFLDVQIHDEEQPSPQACQTTAGQIECKKEKEAEESNEGNYNRIQHTLAVMSLSIAAEWALQNNANSADIQALMRLKDHALSMQTKQKS